MKGICLNCWYLVCFVLLFLPLSGCSHKDLALYTRGQTACNHGQFDEAIEAFDTLASNYPQSPHREKALFQLGDIYYRYVKNHEKAINYYSQVLNNYPDSLYICDISLNIGDMYFKTFEEYERAVNEFQKVIVHCTDIEKQAIAQMRIGDCYFEAGSYEQAIIEYQLVITQFPESTRTRKAHKHIADCYFILGEMKEAERNYRKSLTLLNDQDPDESIKISLAQALVSQGEHCLAVELYRELLERDPNRHGLQTLLQKAESLCHKSDAGSQETEVGK
ncbi:tetratricopeptide repeat protein [bacterium]|nr:tetratricopeptide repeat protein [bacterium]